MTVETPHFEVPFKWTAQGSAAVVEQRSPEDITQCIDAIVNTPRGFRLEIPTFGIRKPVLQENGPSLTELQAAIEEWEPRANYMLSDRQFEDILSRYVSISVERKSENG